jgi:hypothetical protein
MVAAYCSIRLSAFIHGPGRDLSGSLSHSQKMCVRSCNHAILHKAPEETRSAHRAPRVCTCFGSHEIAIDVAARMRS